MNTIHFVNHIHSSAPGDVLPHDGARGGKRERKRAARLERIVDTAMRLVSERGFDGMTVQQLARELDYAPAALYRYFASKDELVAMLQTRAIAELRRDFERARDRWVDTLPSDTRVAALVELLHTARFYRQLRGTSPRVFHLLSVTLADPRKLVDDVASAVVAPPMMGVLSFVSVLFEAAARLGALNDAQSALERTIVFWSSSHGVMMLQKLERLAPRSFDTTALNETLTNTLLAGWGATQDDLAAAQTWIQNEDTP